MEWWGLACGIMAVVLGIIALVRIDFARHEPVRVPVKPMATNSYVTALTAPDPEVKEWVIDFSGKARHREESVAEWNEMFLSALGEDREVFVKEWAGDSERVKLAQNLRADEERELAAGRMANVAALFRLREDVWANPEKPLDPRVLVRAVSYRLALVEDEASRMQGVDTRKVRRNKPVRPTQQELKQMMQDDLAVLEREHQKRLDEDN